MSSSPAAQHKEKGNESFKAGNYPEAIGHYTAAIIADSTDPTFPLNRAAAYLKLNKNQDAERDCSTVLKLQPNNVKALFRRAQARVVLGKFADARTDLLAAAKAEPGNAAIRAEFSKVEELIAESAKKTKAVKGTPISVPTRAPGQTQVSGTPYRRRVPIAIKDEEPQGDTKDKGKQRVDSKPTPPKGILQGTSSPSPSPSTSGTSTAGSKDLLTPVSTRLVSSASPRGVSSVPTQAPAAEPSTPVAPSQQGPTSTPNAQPPAPVPVAQLAPIDSSAVETSLASTLTPLDLPVEPAAAPPNLISFLQKWTNANSDGERAQILFTVPPNSIPSLFGPTLESPLLGAMLAALAWAAASADSPEFVRDRVLEYMRGLAGVSRFPTLVMFLDGEERKTAGRVWDAIGGGQDERKRWGC
ncbi:RNA polymerase II-associated protein 3 [Ceratobasidium sp. AG-Ba]|nr:RNA polymerase II-associated protein 3 [Ceratobasidium sp. AG-Ba]QRW06445.1 RNA polymerase II-associated protein 3 [Ceratobasidium sp. AG-Ba]